MALRCLGVLISKELSAGVVRRISTTASRQMLHDSPNAHLNKQLLNRYTRLQKNIDPKLIQATYVSFKFNFEKFAANSCIRKKFKSKMTVKYVKFQLPKFFPPGLD